MPVNPRTARILFGAALTLYLLWIAALASLDVLSAHGRADVKPPRATAPDVTTPKPPKN